MSVSKVGMAFSREFKGNSPLGHIGVKLPVYLRLLELCQDKGWEVYVLTKKTYKSGGVFAGCWKFDKGKFKKMKTKVKMDLVYDRSAGVKFPPEGDEGTIWVNRRDFKVLCWDKWKAYKILNEHMPKTFLVKRQVDIANILPKISTQWVVLKPYNGLKGQGVFVGPKSRAIKFRFPKKFKKYIAQEFVDTSQGIPLVASGLHDLRVAIVNAKAVWSNVRIPQEGSFKANVAEGGNLHEIDYETKVPHSVKKIVDAVIKKFFEKYNDPSYSIDFGIGPDGVPKIFEINDQIGFPRWEMKNRDNFLKELVYNFERKLNEKNRQIF